MIERKVIRAEDVMSERFIIVDGLATVAEALAELKARDAACIIVRKRHDDDEYGIVLLSDIAKQVIARGKSLERVNVYEIMSKPVISIRPAMDVRYIARLFETFGLNMAPVLHSGKVMGVVSYSDIVLGAVSAVGSEDPSTTSQ